MMERKLILITVKEPKGWVINFNWEDNYNCTMRVIPGLACAFGDNFCKTMVNKYNATLMERYTTFKERLSTGKDAYFTVYFKSEEEAKIAIDYVASYVLMLEMNNWQNAN